MKLRTRLMLFTAASALSANLAHAAINPRALADAYLAEGYSYVEVETGPTQTKLEAVKGTVKVEVVYENETGAVLKQEIEDAGDDYLGLAGVEIEDSDDDFLDDDDDEDEDEDDEDEDDDDEDEDDDDDDDDDDDEDDDDDDDDDDDRGDDDNDDDRDDDRGDDGDDGDDGGDSDSGDSDGGDEGDDD